MSDFLNKVKSFVVKHWKVILLSFLALVLVVIAISCQGLANVNGDGNTMVLGSENGISTDTIVVKNEL